RGGRVSGFQSCALPICTAFDTPSGSAIRPSGSLRHTPALDGIRGETYLASPAADATSDAPPTRFFYAILRPQARLIPEASCAVRSEERRVGTGERTRSG